MYHSIKGKLTGLNPTEAWVETLSGITFDIQVSLNTYSALQGLDEVNLLTHFVVREDHQQLYGFLHEDERQLFRMLIGVSGIGPNTARTILSYTSPVDFKQMLLTGQIAGIQKIKGIGPKTAQRLMVELKDKVSRLETGTSTSVSGVHNKTKEEALAALVILGFNRNQVEKAVDAILAATSPDISVESVIKSALRSLS
jgi:Holliday junction DNA helicase RuvA